MLTEAIGQREKSDPKTAPVKDAKTATGTPVKDVKTAAETPVKDVREAPAKAVKAAPVKEDKEDKRSMSSVLYDEIERVIGGDNDNQFFCLTMPGQALNAADYSYDYKNGGTKGPKVEANESRLANKLFDPCRVTGADNGMTLPYQYRSALDMLSPKLDLNVAEAKNSLRKLLLTPYPYKFTEDDTAVHSLQDVYFFLYDQWVEEETKWSEEQSEQKQKLGDGTDAYLDWYESVAESRLSAIDEKMSKVISVFTPNDMKILEGILDSGSGAELQEARAMLDNTRKRDPNGGYIYPVSFQPSNWFELLSTSFTPTDLLDDPSALAQKLKPLSVRRMTLNTQIESISALVPETDRLKELKEKVTDAETKVSQAESDLVKDYGDGVRDVFHTVCDLVSAFSSDVPKEVIKQLAGGMTLPSGKNIDELVDALFNTASAGYSAQQAYASAVSELADAAAEEIAAQGLEQLSSALIPLKAKLAEVDEEIAELKSKIQLSSAVNGSGEDSRSAEEAVGGNSVPEGYTRILISTSASHLSEESSQESSSTVKKTGASLFFCGGSGTSEKQESAFSKLSQSADSSIDIGMNVAKVSIERGWFDPGVFALTGNMFNLTPLKVAPPSRTYDSFDDRLKDMASGNCVFPCYPTAMLIARDISVRFTMTSDISSEVSSAISEHASSGGGFLFFSGSHGSSRSSSDSAVHSTSTGSSVTLRFDTPQIIGYYLECTHADDSIYIDDPAAKTQMQEYVTIAEFVEKYQKLIEAMADVKARSGAGS